MNAIYSSLNLIYAPYPMNIPCISLLKKYSKKAIPNQVNIPYIDVS